MHVKCMLNAEIPPLWTLESQKPLSTDIHVPRRVPIHAVF